MPISDDDLYLLKTQQKRNLGRLSAGRCFFKLLCCKLGLRFRKNSFPRQGLVFVRLV